MPKVDFSMNQLGLILRTIRDVIPKAEKSMVYSQADHSELLEIENKIIDTAFKRSKSNASYSESESHRNVRNCMLCESYGGLDQDLDGNSHQVPCSYCFLHKKFVCGVLGSCTEFKAFKERESKRIVEGLLNCPDLNFDELDELSIEQIDKARKWLEDQN